jgi:hypothetical protein
MSVSAKKEKSICKHEIELFSIERKLDGRKTMKESFIGVVGRDEDEKLLSSTLRNKNLIQLVSIKIAIQLSLLSLVSFRADIDPSRHTSRLCSRSEINGVAE